MTIPVSIETTQCNAHYPYCSRSTGESGKLQVRSCPALRLCVYRFRHDEWCTFCRRAISNGGVTAPHCSAPSRLTAAHRTVPPACLRRGARCAAHRATYAVRRTLRTTPRSAPLARTALMCPAPAVAPAPARHGRFVKRASQAKHALAFGHDCYFKSAHGLEFCTTTTITTMRESNY